MSASSRTATADGRKKITIARSHKPRLASPNWLAAVVSQRRPTMALMLNSTTSRKRMTRGSWVIRESRPERVALQLMWSVAGTQTRRLSRGLAVLGPPRSALGCVFSHLTALGAREHRDPAEHRPVREMQELPSQGARGAGVWAPRLV